MPTESKPGHSQAAELHGDIGIGRQCSDPFSPFWDNLIVFVGIDTDPADPTHVVDYDGEVRHRFCKLRYLGHLRERLHDVQSESLVSKDLGAFYEFCAFDDAFGFPVIPSGVIIPGDVMTDTPETVRAGGL